MRLSPVLVFLLLVPLACGYANYADPIDSFSIPPSLAFSSSDSQKSFDVSVTDSAVYYKGYYSFGDGSPYFWYAPRKTEHTYIDDVIVYGS
jgi:hypothetical protein